MFKLELRLLGPQGKELSLQWEIMNTIPANLWLRELVGICRSDLPLFPRFTGFISPDKTFHSISEKLRQCIDIINRDGRYTIKELPANQFEQSFANAIHHHFEILRGPAEIPTNFFL